MSDQIAIFQHFFKYFRVIVFIFLDPALWIYFLFGEFTMNLLFFLRLRFLTSGWPFWTSEWPFLTLSITLNDYDIHAIRIRIEFGIESYAHHVYMVVFQIYDPKMTFFPLRWPRLTLRCTLLNWKQNSRSIYMYIMCILPCFKFLTSNDHFGPQNDIFHPQDDLGWPWHAHH